MVADAAPGLGKVSKMIRSFATALKSLLVPAAVITFFIVTFTTQAGLGQSTSQPKSQPTLKALRGANQQTPYASQFPASLVAWVTDPTGHSLQGVSVDFTADAGIALSAPRAITDEYGLASVVATGLTPCTSRVSASIAGFPRTRASFDSLIVEKAPLTIVPDDLKSLVGTVPTITGYTITGFVNGETADTAQVTGIPQLTTTARQNSPHANYAIKGGVGSLSAPNYRFVPGFGTLAIFGPDSADPRDHEPLITVSSLSTEDDDTIAVRPTILNHFTLSRPDTSPISAPVTSISLPANRDSHQDRPTLQAASVALPSTQPLTTDEDRAADKAAKSKAVHPAQLAATSAAQ
jgi:hypothetical protein